MKTPFDYEIPWRPRVEIVAAVAWAVAAAASILTTTLTAHSLVGLELAAGCAAMAIWRGTKAAEMTGERNRMDVDSVEFIKPDELIELARRVTRDGLYWLGRGFAWTDVEATKLNHTLAEGPVNVLGDVARRPGGAYWVHGLAGEHEITSELGDLEGHVVIVGATRQGKTRAAELLAAQAIVRGEPVLVFDPKNEGLHGLAGNLKRICERLGCPERFAYFNFAFPDESIRIDPLRNYSSPTELPSRIAPLIPSETGNDPFTSFAWDVLNAETLGMLYVGEKPTLKRYRFYTENGVANLLLRAILKLFDSALGADWEQGVSDWATARGMLKGRKGDAGEIQVRQSLNLLLAYYTDMFATKGRGLEAIDALAVIHRHPAEHTQKMIANLRPVLTKLTTGVLGDLMSPDPLDVSNNRPMTDLASLIATNSVVYCGLNSLADSAIGSAIGSILLADLAAVAGHRNNYRDPTLPPVPVNIFIDEAAEVLNAPTIQLANKGGGSKMRVAIFTQTFADFAARLGNEYKARQVLGNCNNRIAFRVLDAETQKYICDGIPKFSLKTIGVRYSHAVNTEIHDEYSAQYQEAIASKEADVFPAAMLGELPPLHFIARLSGGRMCKGRIPILADT